MHNPKKILMALGTRPEAIKMAPLYHALKSAPDKFEVLLCVTGQHRGMLDQALEVFEIKPDIDLDLMRPDQDLFDITSGVMLGLRRVLRENKPDILLVHGDTTTALASAMAGFYMNVPVGHVEAGLRTFDMRAPFPEEFNRQVISKIAKWHFAPTATSKINLIKELIPESSISVTGNTVIDSLFWVLHRIDADKIRHDRLCSFLSAKLKFDWKRNNFILITGHRRENFGEGFFHICHAIRELAFKYANFQFVYPVHLNPNVQRPVEEILGGLSNVHLISPLDYEPFVFLLKHCYLVLTDSGGIQEEAPSLARPVLVMRNVTERPEAVEAGTVRLVGSDQAKIVSNVSELIDSKQSYLAMKKSHNPYGDGLACEKIISALGGI